MPEKKKTAEKKSTAARKTPARKTTPRRATAKKAPVKAAPRKRASKAKAVATPVAPTADEIATRAYYLWEQGGADPVVNWCSAEQELRSRAGL